MGSATSTSTSLPQNDENPEQRLKKLELKRQEYEMIVIDDLPPHIKTIPAAEKFSPCFVAKFIVPARTRMALEWLKLVFARETFEDLDEVEDVHWLGDPPNSMKYWDEDAFFGRQRLAGLNHSIIELCTHIPEKLGVTKCSLKKYLEGMSLEEALEKKRIYVVDLEILKDAAAKEGHTICAPIALFFVSGAKDLLPIAIQLFQDKGDDNPVFYPDDPEYTWMMAKLWFNNSDATYHQAVAHLGAHLLLEGFVVTMHRNLSENHPIFKLMAPHFFYNIAINKLARDKLVSVGGRVDQTMSGSLEGFMKLLTKGLSRWRMDEQGTLPNDLRRRGVDDPEALPEYHFRDDALLLFSAIRQYVYDNVHCYYRCDSKIESDWEIQGWITDITKPKCDGGCEIKGVPIEDTLATRSQLVSILTSIIYMGSVWHSSVNYPMFDQYGHTLNYPGFLWGAPPTSKVALTEADVLNALPRKSRTYLFHSVMRNLSKKFVKSLGDFDKEFIEDPVALLIVQHFRTELREIGKKITEANKTRKYPYVWLHPDNVANSISI